MDDSNALAELTIKVGVATFPLSYNFSFSSLSMLRFLHIVIGY
jgi:hypothetical protein